MNESEIVRLADNGINCFAQIKALAQGQTPGPIDPGPGPGPMPEGSYPVEMDWNNPQRITTRGVGPNTKVIVGFTTGAVSSTNDLPHFNIVEGNQSPRQPRNNWIAETPDGAPIGRKSEGEVKFALGTGSGYGYYPVLPLNKKHYLIIEPQPGAGDACDVDVDLIKGAL